MMNFVKKLYLCIDIFLRYLPPRWQLAIYEHTFKIVSTYSKTTIKPHSKPHHLVRLPSSRIKLPTHCARLIKDMVVLEPLLDHPWSEHQIEGLHRNLHSITGKIYFSMLAQLHVYHDVFVLSASKSWSDVPAKIRKAIPIKNSILFLSEHNKISPTSNSPQSFALGSLFNQQPFHPEDRFLLVSQLIVQRAPKKAYLVNSPFVRELLARHGTAISTRSHVTLVDPESEITAP